MTKLNLNSTAFEQNRVKTFMVDWLRRTMVAMTKASAVLVQIVLNHFPSLKILTYASDQTTANYCYCPTSGSGRITAI